MKTSANFVGVFFVMPTNTRDTDIRHKLTYIK